MYSREQLQDIYRRLAEPFSDVAIERTRAAVTKKGYDTTGFKYQYIVNRLNEVLGVGGFRVQREFSIRDKQTRNGYPMVEATCDLTMQLGCWSDGEFVPFAEASGTGGHTAATEADAKKGAFTNGLKKVAAFFGCGWQAYAGVIDDDNVPARVCEDPSLVGECGWPPLEHHHKGAESRSEASATAQDAPRGNGRVTSAQLAKLHELVDQVGGEWGGYRAHVRETHGVNVEYADKKLASALIKELLANVRRRKGNGRQPGRSP